MRNSNARMSVLSPVACRSPQRDTGGEPALISASSSECTQVTLRDLESVVSITQDENHRCGGIGSGRDLSNSDTTRRERGGSRCEPMDQSCTCQSTTRALRMPRALPRRCPPPNHPRRTSGDRPSSHAPTCFRAHHRRVDPRHAGLTDTELHQTPCAPRKTRAATCRPSSVRNLHSHPETISRELRSRSRIFYAPIRRTKSFPSVGWSGGCLRNRPIAPDESGLVVTYAVAYSRFSTTAARCLGTRANNIPKPSLIVG